MNQKKKSAKKRSLATAIRKRRKQDWERYQLNCRPELRVTAQTARLGFYDTEAWRKLRYAAFAKYGNNCQCCGATWDSSGRPLHVDHIKPRSKYPWLELELNNLQILCYDCNLGKSNDDTTDWRIDKTPSTTNKDPDTTEWV